jgi:hypothetical protein
LRKKSGNCGRKIDETCPRRFEARMLVGIEAPSVNKGNVGSALEWIRKRSNEIFMMRLMKVFKVEIILSEIHDD